MIKSSILDQIQVSALQKWNALQHQARFTTNWRRKCHRHIISAVHRSIFRVCLVFFFVRQTHIHTPETAHCAPMNYKTIIRSIQSFKSYSYLAAHLRPDRHQVLCTTDEGLGLCSTDVLVVPGKAHLSTNPQTGKLNRNVKLPILLLTSLPVLQMVIYLCSSIRSKQIKNEQFNK